MKLRIEAVILSLILFLLFPLDVNAKTVGVELRLDGIKLVDLDQIIADGGDLSDVPNDDESSLDTPSGDKSDEADVETNAEDTRESSEQSQNTAKNQADEKPKHVFIRIRNKAIFVNYTSCADMETFKENIDKAYIQNDVIDIYDAYAEYHVMRDIMDYLDSRGYKYNTPTEEEY